MKNYLLFFLWPLLLGINKIGAQCNVGTPDGGIVYIADGMDSDELCGVTATSQLNFYATTTSTASGLSYWYIVTTDEDSIITWVNANTNRDSALITAISGAPSGVCHVWGWSYTGLPNPVVGAHISTLDDDACEEISDNWITVTREDPDGGTVYIADGMNSVELCGVAGTSQLDFYATTSSTSECLSYWYIITTDEDSILTWVNANSDRDFALITAIAGAPAGVCHVWGWSYRGLSDPVVGDHISTLDDDPREDISDNWITVTREEPDGGRVYIADGMNSDELCGVAGTSQLNLYATTTSTAECLSYWYIITTDEDSILTWVNANSNRDSALITAIAGAPAGVCHVWGWSYRGLSDPIVGAHISTLDDDPREDISENWITVYRQDPDGGRVYIADDMNSDQLCGVTGTSQLDFYATTTSSANCLSYWYIITTDEDSILTWVNANSNRDSALITAISGAPAGVCHVWGWSYRGLSDPIVGDHISTLDDDPREDISENWITVYRQDPDGGRVYIADGMNSDELCGVTGTSQLYLHATTTSTAECLSYWYIVTTDKDSILTWVNANSNRDSALITAIAGAPSGVCHVWGWSYRGLSDPVVGDHISTLDDDPREDISENWITVTREEPDGGRVYIADGMNSDQLCGVTGTSQLDLYATTTSTAECLSYWYIITTDEDSILTWVNANSNRDSALITAISGAPTGVCHVWGWSYRGLSDPVVGDHISTLDDDPREDISENWITVYRQDPDGGRVYIADGMNSDELAGVTGTSQLDFYATTTSSANCLSYWYIITTDEDSILTWVNANSNRDSALITAISGAPAGVCHVWGWSYRGLSDPVVGDHISTLDDDPREDISENWITVYRQDPDGGTVYIADGMNSDSLYGRAGTSELDFYMTTTSTADMLSYWYIVTTDQDSILKWVNANSNRDSALITAVSNAPAGVCHIWGWSYRGLSDPVPGAHISTLDDDVEEDISSNWVTVVREDVVGVFDPRPEISNTMVYPNPTREILNFEDKDIEQLNLFSTSGSLLFQGKLIDSKLNVDFLSSGVYFIEAVHRDGRHSATRFVKY